MSKPKVRADERLAWRLRTAGVRRVDYELTLSSQDGRCAICGTKPHGRSLSIDHDHETKVFRGLLCYACNLGLGYFRDSMDLLESAITYLEESVDRPKLGSGQIVKREIRKSKRTIKDKVREWHIDKLFHIVREHRAAIDKAGLHEKSGFGRNLFEATLGVAVKSNMLNRDLVGRNAWFTVKNPASVAANLLGNVVTKVGGRECEGGSEDGKQS